MPCVLVFPPRSNPPGFQSPRICVVKLSMIELRNSSSLGSGFSSAIFKPSSFRCLFINRGDQARDWIAKDGVEYWAKPVIDSAFHLQKEHRGVAHQVQKPRASIGSRHWTADVRIHGTFDGRTI